MRPISPPPIHTASYPKLPASFKMPTNSIIPMRSPGVSQLTASMDRCPGKHHPDQRGGRSANILNREEDHVFARHRITLADGRDAES